MHSKNVYEQTNNLTKTLPKNNKHIYRSKNENRWKKSINAFGLTQITHTKWEVAAYNYRTALTLLEVTGFHLKIPVDSTYTSNYTQSS